MSRNLLLLALKANTSKLHAIVLFWYPGETRANTTAKYVFAHTLADSANLMQIYHIFSPFINISKSIVLFWYPGETRANTTAKYVFAHTLADSANLMQIYHIFSPFINISKSVFSSSVTNVDKICVA